MGQMGGLSLQRDVILVEFMQYMPIISTPLLLWGIRQKPIFTNNKNAPDPQLPALSQTAAQPSFAQLYIHPINPLAKNPKKKLN